MAAANTAKNAYGTGNNNKSDANVKAASSRLSADAVSRLGTGVVQQPTASRTNSGGGGVYTPRVVGSSTPVRLNNYSLKSSAGDTGNPPSGGGGGSPATVTGGGGGGGYSGGGGEDIIGKIKALLEEQKRAADEYYKTMYEQQLSEINQQAENNRNSANLNYMRGDRYLRSMYGNNISGQGLSNRARNNSMWQNNLSSIRQNQANNQATAKSNYNTNLANSASQLAQGWYNYVLPYYSNEANQLRNIELQKYAMSL